MEKQETNTTLNAEPRSTQTFIGKEERAIPNAQMFAYFLEETGYTIDAYLQDFAFDVACDAIGKLLKPDVLGAFQTGLEIYDLISSIDNALKAMELGKAIIEAKNARYLVAIANNYEWISGSGNHIAYNTEMTYYGRN